MSDTEDVLDSEPPTIDPYEVLDIEKDATADQVKSAYRKAALKHHPGRRFRLSQDMGVLTSCPNRQSHR